MKRTSLILSTLLILFAGGVVGEGLTLECKGSASLNSAGVATTTTNTGAFGTTVIPGKNVFSSILLFYMDEENNSGWVKVPLAMQPGMKRKRKEEPFKLTDLSVTDSMIKARFKYKIAKPKITIDRMSGVMEYSAFGVRFNGECSPVVITERKF